MILRTEIGGFSPSPPKSDDYLFGSVLLPKLSIASGDVDLQGFCTPISNQEMISACVANATADAIELCSGLDGLAQVDVSRLQIYFNGRSVMSVDGVTNESKNDKGMYIRAAFQALATFGICPEKLWPYKPEKVNERPDLNATWVALKNKLHSYYKVDSTGSSQLYDISSAIRGRHPVVFGIPVTEAFYKGSRDVIPPPQPGEIILGLHGIMGVGVIGENIKIRNSWGADWSQDGYALLHPDWFNLGRVQDPWVPTNGLVFKEIT